MINTIIIISISILLIISIYININLFSKYSKLKTHFNYKDEKIYENLMNIKKTKDIIDENNYFEYDENMQYIYGVLEKMINELFLKYDGDTNTNG